MSSLTELNAGDCKNKLMQERHSAAYKSLSLVNSDLLCVNIYLLYLLKTKALECDIIVMTNSLK